MMRAVVHCTDVVLVLRIRWQRQDGSVQPQPKESIERDIGKHSFRQRNPSPREARNRPARPPVPFHKQLILGPITGSKNAIERLDDKLRNARFLTPTRACDIENRDSVLIAEVLRVIIKRRNTMSTSSVCIFIRTGKIQPANVSSGGVMRFWSGVWIGGGPITA